MEESDIPGVMDLRLRVKELGVPEKNNPDFWRWENFQNPYGPTMAMIALTGEEVISHIALLPRRLWVNGKSYSCCMALESMTDRRFRAKGLFPRLWFELKPRHQAKEISILFGFPNRYARPIFHKGFKWLDVGSPQLRAYPFRPGQVLRSRGGLASSLLSLPAAAGGFLYRLPFKFKPSGRVSQASAFDERFQPLLDEIHGRHPIILERSVDYLNWRYLKAVARNYTALFVTMDDSETVAGYLVYSRALYEELVLGVVMDLQISENAPDGLGEEMLSTALWQMNKDGAHLALSLSMPADPINRVLRRRGFFFVSRKFNPNPFDLMIELCDKKLNREVLTNPDHWRLGFGDIDVF